MSLMRMIKKSPSLLLAALIVLQLVVSPLTYAQTGEQQQTPPQPDLEVCQLPRQDYKNFSNFRLAYHAAVVDDNPVFAQDHFQSMQDILTTHCSAVASIVQVQAEDLDEQCNALVNHLLAKNNYYISVGRTDDAIATQGLIQTVLLAQDCAPIIQPASEFAIDIVEQEVIANQTIDPSLEVIPYKENVCFNDYGPSHTFRQQVENIQDPTVAVSVFDTVTNYFNQLGAVAIDAIQQQREGTLLAYAKNLLGFRQDALRNLQYKDHVLPFQIAEFVELAAGITDAQGLVQTDAMIGQYMDVLPNLIPQLSSYPLRDSFADPRMQNIFNSFATDPITLTRDEQAQVLTHEAGDKGAKIVFPAIITQQPDPQDPAVMIDVVEQEELIINLLDVQGTSAMIEVSTDSKDEQGNIITQTSMEEEFYPSKIVADVRYAGEKITAVDVSIQHDENGDMSALQIAWYLDPYIFTNNYTRTSTTDVAGTVIETTTMDIRIFGPAGCDVQLAFNGVETTDIQKNTTTTQSIDLVLNNTRVEIDTQDLGAMRSDIQQYRNTVPTATSTPSTANYLVDAKIYHKGVYRAYLYPESDTWLIGFVSGQEPQYFIDELWTPIASDNFASITTYQYIIGLIASLMNGQEEVATPAVRGCTDPVASNYNSAAQQDDGSCDYTANGTGDQTPEPGTGDQTPDPETGTGDQGGSGYQEIPGCMDPTATNYNAEANFDDGSCTLPPSGPVVGCPDEWASNYNPLADPNNEDNWNMCEY